MAILVDTSALFAPLDADDNRHDHAGELWRDLITKGEPLICTNYVLVETFALVQRRLGMEAVRTLQEDLLPFVGVEWVDAASHHSNVMAVLTAGRRGLSLVDCASFETMRRLGIDTAFAFDLHFGEQGFQVVPRLSD